MARYEVFLVVALLCGLASANVVPEGSDDRRSRSTSAVAGTISKKKCVEYSSFVSSPGDGSPRCPGDESTSLKGDKPKPREFPHVALVGYGEKANISWLCGGTLISPRFVLTVALCLSAPKYGAPRWVRVGDINIKETTDGVVPQEAAVLEAIPHPDYKQGSIRNDIGLLKLEKDLDLNEFVRPACLHTTFDIGQSEAILSGWGRRNVDRSSASDDLKKVKIPIQSTEYCNSSLHGLIVGESMICAGEGDRFQGPCYGIVSGYPLQLLNKEPYCMYDIIGIISFGRRVCEESLGGYTRVSHYVPWIEKIVWPEEV